MRYKVGDKVRVRKDLIVGKRYGSYRFSSDMKGFKGKTFNIQKVGSDYYRVEEERFFWTDEMFESITNWDKVKEEMKIEDVTSLSDPLCKAIHRIKNEEVCVDRCCDECRDWLKQPYKEPSILDEAEKKYLSAVIRPWRDRVIGIKKRSSYDDEYLAIIIEENSGRDCVVLPCFKENTMYKGMELNKQYTLDELEI